MAALRRKASSRTSADFQLFSSSSPEDGVAPWFKPEQLTAPGFSPNGYIEELRRFVPLEAVGQELENHLATLKSRLVEVINEDYNDFVSLTTKLVNVDGVVLRMTGPLQEVGHKIAAVHAGLQAELDALHQGLQARQETAAARSLLELMQDTAHTMTKVESLLAEVESEEEAGSSSSSREALESRCQMLERLASEVSRLNFYAAKGQELPFVHSLDSRMEAARQKLRFRLSAALKAALVGEHPLARQHCLQAYSAIQDPVGAEQVVREALIRPLIARVLEQHPSAGPRPGEAFPQVLQALLSGALPQLNPLLDFAGGSEAGSQGFNFLGNSLLAEVDAAVAEHLAGAISPGVPAAFLASYRAATAFIDRLEAACPSRGALLALRGSASFASFLRRWKLSIYFSTRFQEVAGILEEAATNSEQLLPALEGGSQSDPALQLAASQALCQSLDRVVSEEVFLRPLADKFSRLVYQLLARYAAWLRAGLAPASEQPADAAPQEPSWGCNTPIALLLASRADIDALVPHLRADFAPKFVAAFSFLPSQAQESLQAGLEEGLGEVQKQAAPLTAAVVAQLADRCGAALSQLRGITAMYRMSARPPPTRPSHYVTGILQSLGQALELPTARLLSASARQELSEAVVSAVASKFCKMSEELLDTLRRTESSLKRIRQSRAAAGGGGTSDIEKISLQLFLDAQEFGRQASKFGVTAANLPSYQALWKAVAPADKAESIEL